jgi:signal transduction histidine kinase
VNVEAQEPLCDDVLGDLRHRLRTPLNHIIGYSELLLEDIEPDQTDIADDLRKVGEYGQTILTQIQQLLSPTAGGATAEKIERVRAEIAEPLRLIIAKIAMLAGRLRGEALPDVLRINLACASLLSFAHGQDPLREHTKVTSSPAGPLREPAPEPSSRVLVVDDNDANRDMLNRQLVRYGHTADCFETGESALKALGEQAFDLVLVDVMMPGMSGIEVLQNIKSNPLLADIPVIMISALDEQEGAARCIEMGAEDYLLKPFNPVLLRARLHSALERKRFTENEKRRTRELEKASQDLKRANEDLNAFAFAASHDLQEPLRTVTTTLQLLFSELEAQLTQEQRKLIDLAVDGSLRMRNLIADLLSYSLASSRDRVLETVALDSVLDEALSNLRQAAEESGASITHDALPVIMADRAQFVQLFQNLIGNAIKYRREQPPEIHVSAQRNSAEWVVSISDNGIGIEEEYRQVIFQPFRRLHGRSLPGTGLGLAICERIVVEAGGRIWVESQVGRGSTFHFTVADQE